MTNLRRVAPLLAAILVLAPFTWVAFRYSDLPQFGKYQDDGLLLVAGKSLHDSAGYRIASFPGAPYQTKYPPLYPLLLSGLWSVDGHFPENLRLLALSQWAIVMLFFGAVYTLMRSYAFSSWAVAVAVAFLAVNPWLVYWALVPFADFAFALLAVAAFTVLQKYREDPRAWWIAGCLGAAACLTKVTAVLIVPAILVCCRRRRDWVRAAAITLPVAIAGLGWTAWAALHRLPAGHPVTWYYTDYFAVFWKNGALAALPDIVPANILSLIAVTGNTLLYNLADSMLGRFLSIILLAGAISGTVRLIRRTKQIEYPVFCGMVLVLLLIWDFSPNIRLLAPVVPLFAMGLCEEGGHLYALIRVSLESKKASDRIAAQVIRAGVYGGLVCALVLNAAFLLRSVPRMLENDRLGFGREQALFAWCRDHLPASASLLTQDDAILYLSTGLRAVSPVPNSVAFYEHDEAGEFEYFTHADQLANAFGLTHILITPRDFGDFEPSQRPRIVETLVNNPHHRKVYGASGGMVLAIEQ